MLKRLVAWGALVVASLALAGCSSGGGDVALPGTTTTTSMAAGGTATSAAAAVSGPVTAPSTTLAQGFISARAQWEAGAKAVSAQQSAYFAQAVADLRTALDNGPGSQVVAEAIGALQQLALIPETDADPAQQAEAKSDVMFLDNYFGTPGLFQ
jgi:hypothetical protein